MATKSVSSLLHKRSAAVFVCDIQERFRSVIKEYQTVIGTAHRVVRGANALDVPVLVTEQYPKALGHTVSELQEVIKKDAPVFPKTKFSMIIPEVEQFLQQNETKHVILVGIEAHVCVLQTTLDLLQKGVQVHVIVDGVSSSRMSDRAVALHRMSQAGAWMCTSDMVLFQMAGDSKAEGFKAISEIAKEPRDEALHLTSML